VEETVMARSLSSRIRRAAVVGGISAAAILGTAGAAFAAQSANATVLPGNQACTATQYASYQVRGVLISASGQGVRMKLLRNGQVVEQLPGRVPSGSLQELPPTFSGPGNYQFCVNNTGTAPSTVSMVLYTDGEVR
jgi:hypothetical protein